MHVLIIGGTGLISTAIVDQLLERGDDVTLFNRGLSEARFAHPERVHYLRGDRSDFAAFEAEMARHTFDAVIDMVAFAPEAADSLLRAFTGRTQQIVVCSTVCVYGGPMTALPAADDEPHRSVTDYGRNNSAIEHTLLSANGKNGLHTTVLRPSFTTGEGHLLGAAIMFDDSLARPNEEGTARHRARRRPHRLGDRPCLRRCPRGSSARSATRRRSARAITSPATSTPPGTASTKR